MKENPLVSVIVITYNHREYIRQAIDSIINQRIDFSYEILIGDDASDDGTGKIIKEYAERYSDIIKLYIREKNVGATKNDYLLKCAASGKYIAQLEGDDFWTDEYKLQKQVDFLENNSEYSGCTHYCEVVNDCGEYSRLSGLEWVNPDCESYGISDFERWTMPGHTSSMVYKNMFKNKDCSVLYKLNTLVGDRTMALIMLMEGQIYCIPEYMSCYRYIVKNNGINWASQTDEDGSRYYKDYCYICNLEKFAWESYGKIIDVKCRKQELLLELYLIGRAGKYPRTRKWYKDMLKRGRHRFRDRINCIAFGSINETVRKCCYRDGVVNSQMDTWRQFRYQYKALNKPSIALFGAGKCSAEYMEIYGEILKPICIIDNDSNKWGKYENGIIINSPQYLVTMKENELIVIITNLKYADNIKEQLDNMNVISYSYTQLEYNRFYYKAYRKWNKL